MNSRSILLSILLFVSSALAQLPPTFFTSQLSGGFPGFGPNFGGPFGSPQFASQQQQVPTPGNGRASQGPILFPPAPESRDTSGVVVGASGYGFIPPGVREIIQGRGLQTAQFPPTLGQAFSTNYFNL